MNRVSVKKESMSKNNYLAGAFALILLVIVGGLSYNLGKKEASTAQPEMRPPVDHSTMSMEQMSGSLEDLQGDAFDKAFLEMMIVHHQGAVDMAKHIPEQAKHEELKKLGEEIVTAQTKEIEMMQSWLRDWGYDDAEAPQSMDHRAH